MANGLRIATTRLILLLGELSCLPQRIVDVIKLVPKVLSSYLILIDALAKSERRLDVLVLNVIGDNLSLHNLVLLELARGDIRECRPQARLLAPAQLLHRLV